MFKTVSQISNKIPILSLSLYSISVSVISTVYAYNKYSKLHIQNVEILETDNKYSSPRQRAEFFDFVEYDDDGNVYD